MKMILVRSAGVAVLAFIACTVIASAQRTVRIGASSGGPGGMVSVPIELDALGDEQAGQFSIDFNPAVLSLSGPAPVTAGEGAPMGTTISTNTTQAATGKVAILVESFPNPFPAANARVIVRIEFAIAATAPSECSAVTFGDTPAARFWSNSFGGALSASYVDGCVDVGGGGGPVDSDGDGVADPNDAYPQSDVSATTKVQNCDSRVANRVLNSGASFNDLIRTVVASARNRGQMVSGVTGLMNGWRDQRLINQTERNAIHRCL
jgi:hypothetical protein